MPKQEAWAVNVSVVSRRLLGDVACNEEVCEDLHVSPDGKNVVWPAKEHLWIGVAPSIEQGNTARFARC